MHHISPNLEIPRSHEEALNVLCFQKMTEEKRREYFDEAAQKAKASAPQRVIDMFIDFEIRHFGCPTTSIGLLARQASPQVQAQMLEAAIKAVEVLDVLRMEEVLDREISEKEAEELADRMMLFGKNISYRSMDAKAFLFIARRYPEDSPLHQKLMAKIVRQKLTVVSS